jgi:hypothetical protein
MTYAVKIFALLSVLLLCLPPALGESAARRMNQLLYKGEVTEDGLRLNLQHQSITLENGIVSIRIEGTATTGGSSLSSKQHFTIPLASFVAMPCEVKNDTMLIFRSKPEAAGAGRVEAFKLRYEIVVKEGTRELEKDAGERAADSCKVYVKHRKDAEEFLKLREQLRP